MFEYNGIEYNQEEVMEMATNMGISLDEYLKRNPEVKKIEKSYNEGMSPDFQTPTTPGAVVEETAAPDMESKSDPGSGESPEDPNKKIIINPNLGISTFGLRKKIRGATQIVNFLGDVPEYIKGYLETTSKNRAKFRPDVQKLFKNSYGAETQEQREILIEESVDAAFEPLLEKTKDFREKSAAVNLSLDSAVQEDPSRSMFDEFFSNEGNFSDGIDKLSNGIIDAVPSVMAAFSGPVGLATLYASASGGAYRQKIEAEPDKRGDSATFLMSSAQGGVELISEIVTRGIVKGFGPLGNFAPKQLKEIYKRTSKTLAGRILIGANLEGSSEVGAEEVNRYLDYIWDENNAFGYKNIDSDGNTSYNVGNILERVFETYMISSIVGGNLSLLQNNPSTKVYLEEKLTPTKNKKENLKIVNQITKLENQYNKNPNDLILDEILELQQKVTDAKVLNEKVLNSFDQTELENYSTSKVEISRAKEELKNIEDAETKKIVENKIRKEESKLDNIYNDKLTQLIEILEKPIKPEGVLMSDFGVISAADKLREVALDKATQKKVSNDVQKIYEEQGVDGALDIIEKFRPITNKLVRKRRDAPNYDEQLLRDEIETGERGIFDLIRSYKPDSGVPLSGYINKFLKARAIEASNRVLGKEFTQDVTEIKESKIDLDDTTQETLDFVRTEPKAKEQLRDIAGITKESVQTEAKQILKGKLPGIIEKSGRDKNEILTEINKLSKFKIADSVLEEMGGNFSTTEEQNSRFASFLSSNYDAIIKSIPNAVKNKLPLFEKIDTGKREQTKEGKKIFEYKNPTQEQMLSYYTEGGLTTLRARKKTLADNLAQEIGKDAIAEVLSDPQVQKDFLERQELQGKKIPEGAIPKLLERIDRYIDSIDTKDPGILATGISPVFIKKAFKGGLKAFRATLKKTNDFQKALSAFIKKIKTYFKSKEERKIAEEVIRENVTVDNIESLDIDAIINEFAEKLNISRGIAYEKVVYKEAKGVKNPIFKIVGKQTEEGGAPDIQFEIAGQPFNVEVKLETARYGSVLANANLETLDNITFAKDYTFNKEVEEAIKNNKENLNNYRKEAQALGQNMADFDKGIINKDIWEKLQKKGLLRKARTNITLSTDIVKEIYNKKNPPVYDIQIKGKGLFYMNKNTFNLSRPELSGEVEVEVGLNTSGTIYKQVKGKKIDTGNRKFHIRMKPYKLIGIGKSPLNIETANGINKLLKSDGILDLVNKQKIKEETDNIDLNKEFNNILENKTGIKSVYRYAKAKAEVAGKDKGSFDYIGIPPSAQDFMGLLYKMVGKGKQGDLQLAWFKKNLLDPFAKAMVDISNTRVALANDFKQIKKIANIAPKVLKNKLPGEPFTVEQAIRVYIWNKQNMDVDGLSQADLKTLVNYVKEDANLLSFADQLIQINKDMAYPKPDKNWLMGTMTTDLLQGLNTTTRKEALSQWQSNVDIIFSEANMNKLEAAFGKGYRSALNNMLQRMQTGRNRGYPGDQLTGRFVDWLNGSVGAIMFFNMRSAVLQTISSINFINFTDNNPLKAAAAFANQPQYWKDVMFIMNSDYLIERRNGLKINVNEADIAEIAAESKNKAKAFVNKLLKLGFLPTQIADSFAIATGGASFYRNRVKSYIKKGLSEKEAQDKAFLDFREITEENQQSSRPDRISQQQAGPLGRIILAFANTPAQYARIIQRAASDLKNGRGDAKTNISKIIYYGAIQNVIFNAMQQALFAIAFGDEEPDDEKEAEKYGNIVNGMVDSLLRGTGFAGAAVSTVKNAIIKIAKDGNKQDIAIDLINISPPISSKIRKVRSAGRTFDWNKKEIKEKGLSLDNPAAMAIGQLVSATTNVPLDRGIKKLTNIKDALDTENEEWMRIANALGWSKWELEWEQDKRKKKDTGRKEIERTNINRKNITREQIKRN